MHGDSQYFYLKTPGAVWKVRWSGWNPSRQVCEMAADRDLIRQFFEKLST